MTPAHQVWTFDPHEGYLSSAVGLPKRWGEGRCLQFSEPNPKVFAGAAMKISGLQRPPSWGCEGPVLRTAPNSWTPTWNFSSTCNTTFALLDGAEIVLTTAVTFAGDCVACDQTSSPPSVNDVVRSAVALVSGRGSDTAARISDHRAWWS